MHEEWFPGSRTAASQSTASSWSNRRLLATAMIVTASVLLIGTSLAQILGPAVGNPPSAVPTEVAGTVLEAPPTDIGEAAVETRSGVFEAAPTEHLTVVQISVSVCGSRSTGSGVVISDGLILTAAHVVGDAGLVRIDHRGQVVTGEVLGVLGDGRDLALVAVDAPLAAPVVGADVPRPGGALTLVGHPGGGPRTEQVGPVVVVAPVVATLAGPGEIIGVDVSITEGISGGPAVDAGGAVVGIVVARETATDTALVIALPDLAQIPAAGLVPGECPGSA